MKLHIEWIRSRSSWYLSLLNGKLLLDLPIPNGSYELVYNADQALSCRLYMLQVQVQSSCSLADSASGLTHAVQLLYNVR